MPSNQLPLGVVNRPVPDWFASSLSGGHVVQNAVAGQNSYVGIYNNASDGSVIRVYGVAFFLNNSSFVYFEVFQGQQGSIYNADGEYGSIDPRVGSTWGQTINFSSAVCLGRHIGGISGYGSIVNQYAPGWPIGIVPAGYTWALQTRSQQVTIEAGIFWLSAYN